MSTDAPDPAAAGTDGPSGVETELRLRPAPPAAAFDAARARLVARAAVDGLVDVAYEDHETPLGVVRIGATRRGIVRLLLPAEDHDLGLQELADQVSPRIVRTSTPGLTTARRELDEYFAGDRRGFDVPVDWALTRAFRREVLRATAAIPYGGTSTYRGVATAAGSPGAVRAAGTALARNPVPILVPCHRVLRTDGGLGQYRGGVAAKERLLALEQAA
ncbi:methylated-DNA--[protein]-cysteine S-methyltransferase [Patulibacter sp.]|uniref:methylated-DNA--[protein]-cysteine S-methyltransferase n=1 Tax=Patulibacter sp. TaxID=1912859 RepID=UPI00271EF3A6|nr:methylated-DNA--[protein]-cysteine S-methyltransferase [Patulibacter sp.]MDO9407970.1 methylated-DNA--[protein]-cysteine S-methyltransferase [Patulibacter sp.]